MRVVVDAPVLGDHACITKVVEVPAVEEFVTEPAVVRLDPWVLPRAAWVDDHAGGAGEAAPVRGRVRDELGSVVEAA